MALTLVTAPEVEPITDAEIREHLHIDSGDGSALVNTYINAAVDYCEKFQNRVYIEQIWYLTLDDFPRYDVIPIPLPPLMSVSSVTYYGTGGTSNTMTTTSYIVDTASSPGRLSLAYGESWPSIDMRPVNGVVVKFTAGYGSAATSVPAFVKQAIKLLVGHWYEHREDTDIKLLQNIPAGVESLLTYERIWPI